MKRKIKSGIGDIVPQEKNRRKLFRKNVSDFVSCRNITPPLSMEEISSFVDIFLQEHHLSSEYTNFSSVLINNEVWKRTLSSIPFERRVLMIPQCLRNVKSCNAEMDRFGLLCRKCGSCPIGKIQNSAEKLGYVVIVAEGTTLVTKLLQSGKIDGVIGIGCMSVLEKVFSSMSLHAIPGIAIPLNKDGCVDTEIDCDWVIETINFKSDGKWIPSTDIDALRKEVKSLFLKANLRKMLACSRSETETLAIKYLSESGKRWRPFLAVGIYKTIRHDTEILPDTLTSIAVAVECFHKASLIHDDIEDDDDFREGKKTLHKQYGIGLALNTGDILLGMGYMLISESHASDEDKIRMLKAAAEGHTNLCDGQGDELFLASHRLIPSTEKAIDIFRKKTSPAFEVALVLGAVCAGGDAELCGILKRFSESLGVAYQIRDDIKDFDTGHFKVENMLRSVINSIAYKSADPADKVFLKRLFSSDSYACRDLKRFRAIVSKHRALEKASQLCEHYKNEAIRSISTLQSSSLKSFLRKVMSKML